MNKNKSIHGVISLTASELNATPLPISGRKGFGPVDNQAKVRAQRDLLKCHYMHVKTRSTPGGGVEFHVKSPVVWTQTDGSVITYTGRKGFPFVISTRNVTVRAASEPTDDSVDEGEDEFNPDVILEGAVVAEEAAKIAAASAKGKGAKPSAKTAPDEPDGEDQGIEVAPYVVPEGTTSHSIQASKVLGNISVDSAFTKALSRYTGIDPKSGLEVIYYTYPFESISQEWSYALAYHIGKASTPKGFGSPVIDAITDIIIEESDDKFASDETVRRIVDRIKKLEGFYPTTEMVEETVAGSMYSGQQDTSVLTSQTQNTLDWRTCPILEENKAYDKFVKELTFGRDNLSGRNVNRPVPQFNSSAVDSLGEASFQQVMNENLDQASVKLGMAIIAAAYFPATFPKLVEYLNETINKVNWRTSSDDETKAVASKTSSSKGPPKISFTDWAKQVLKHFFEVITLLQPFSDAPVMRYMRAAFSVLKAGSAESVRYDFGLSKAAQIEAKVPIVALGVAEGSITKWLESQSGRFTGVSIKLLRELALLMRSELLNLSAVYKICSIGVDDLPQSLRAEIERKLASAGSKALKATARRKALLAYKRFLLVLQYVDREVFEDTISK